MLFFTLQAFTTIKAKKISWRDNQRFILILQHVAGHLVCVKGYKNNGHHTSEIKRNSSPYCYDVN